jgi:hypothetical protein
MVWQTIRFSPRTRAKAVLAKVAASGRLRAARLLFETSKGWSVAVAVLAVADAVLPNLVLIALGGVTGGNPCRRELLPLRNGAGCHSRGVRGGSVRRRPVASIAAARRSSAVSS